MSSRMGAGYLPGLLAVGAVLFAFAVVGFGFFVVAGPSKFQTLPEGIYLVELSEYEIAANPEPIIARVGQPITLQIVNTGTLSHEFMLAPDPEGMVSMMRKQLEDFLARNPEATEEEAEEFLEELHHAMLEMMEKALAGRVEGPLMIELEPGERDTVTLVFNEPGVYTVVCMEVEATLPQFHVEQGMFTQIIVVG